MKKKMLTAIGVAFVLVAFMAVTAFAGVSLSGGPETVNPGDTIQITITGTGEGVNGSIQTSGLEYVEEDSQLSGPNAFVLLPDFGTSDVVYTYKVTAESGTVSVTLSDVYQAEDGNAVAIDAPAPWTATVVAPEPTPTPTTEPTETPAPTSTPSEEPTATPSASASASASAAPSATAKPTAAPTNTQDRVPKTGDATMDLWVLAILGAGCAAVAVVAGKKAWSAK